MQIDAAGREKTEKNANAHVCCLSKYARHPTGRAPGRGAYLCRDRDCLAKAIKEKRLDRALKAPVPAAAVTRLQEMLAGEKNDTGS